MKVLRLSSGVLLLGLGSLAYLAPITSSEAGMRCGVGKPNKDTGMCDCPAGYRSIGTAGNSECELVARPKPAGAASASPSAVASSAPSPAKATSDAGALVSVKAGIFRMGSDDAALAHAGPAHVVTMGDVDIDKYEVTVDEYKKCVDAGICTPPPAVLPKSVLNPARCNYGSGRGSHPMNCLTWQEAVNYCGFKGRRLPTEAEWEYAARGGVATHKYPWGAAEPTCALANYTADPAAPVAGCGDGTSPVGAHPGGASPQGANDLAGNVEEWVEDWFAAYNGTAGTNPGGPATGTLRVAKGTSWDWPKPSELDVARREGMDPSHRANWLGFRCAKGTTPPAPTPAMYSPIETPPPTIAGGAATTPSAMSPSALPTGTVAMTSTPTPSDAGTTVHVAGGTFTMGDAGEPLSSPPHKVSVGPYSIDKYEVTVAQYKLCVASGACDAPSSAGSGECNYSRAGRDGHPINCVRWEEAKAYCAWNGKRLPSEAEWEFAARGGASRIFPWGSEPPTCGRAAFKPKVGPMCSAGTSVVGSHALGASPFGAMDMAGNVDEWVWDVYAPYTAAALVNPFGAIRGGKHVIRGGNWNYDGLALRTFARWYAEKAGDYIGFRCAKTG